MCDVCMVNERTKDEETLQLSQFTIEKAQDAVLWIDADASIHRVNNAACRLFGYSREDMLQSKIYTFLPDETEQSWRERWEELQKEKNICYERRQQKKNGDWVSVEVRANLIEHEGRQYLCSFLHDISEWKQVEERLQESQRALSTLINNLPGAVYRCKPDEQMTIEFITAWCWRITGYAPRELTHAVKLIHPDDLDKVLAYFQEVLMQQKAGRIIYRILTATGSERWISNRFRGVYSDAGDVIAVEGFFNDISPQIQAEKDLTHALLEVEFLKNRVEEENIYLRQEIKHSHNFEEMIFKSERFAEVLAQVEKVASTDATVLILGESGTGKELIARAVHNLSPRKERPLVKVNCAALPANLIESELFGHEKGAFTGAIAQKIGRFELADGSSIFLDEIGELPLDLQVKLLRVLQESEFERLGNPNTKKVNVRIIAATNRNLEKAVEEGGFREDLYFRLNVFPLHIPPLRERAEDIPLLVEHFVRKFSKKVGKQIGTIPRKVMENLEGYHWPGNIRELENIIERAVIVSSGERLELGDWFISAPSEKYSGIAPLKDAERAHIIKALEFTNWRVSGEKGAAKILDINSQTLVSRMKKLGIVRPT